MQYHYHTTVVRSGLWIHWKSIKVQGKLLSQGMKAGIGVAHHTIVTQFSAAPSIADLSWDHPQ